MTPRKEVGVVYELTIVGCLGPALLRALEPCAAKWSEPQTILRTAVPDGRDLVELLVAIQERGLDIADIVELT
jgi:hypothetical protein